MNRTRCLALVLPALFAAAALAQTPSPAAVPSAALPADPATLLQLASQVNGLHGLRKPWHLHLSFQVLDHDRHTVDQGTVEVWWAEAEKYRIAMKSDRYSSTRYVADGRAVTAGGQKAPIYPFNLILAALQNPLPDEAWIASMKLTRESATVNGEAMDCVAARSPLAANPPDGPAESRYCFEGSSPAVRFSDLDSGGYAFDSVSEFDGSWLPRLLRINSPGQYASEVEVRIDSLEALGPVAADTFTPPLSAAPSSVPVPPGVMAGKRISGKTPKYPSAAKKKHIQGTVVLLATIDKEGKISNLEVVSGPPELQGASVEAVRDWRYTPYLLNGEPVEVETQINVTFALGQ